MTAKTTVMERLTVQAEDWKGTEEKVMMRMKEKMQKKIKGGKSVTQSKSYTICYTKQKVIGLPEQNEKEVTRIQNFIPKMIKRP